MKKEDLREYEFQELSFIAEHSASTVNRGYIVGPNDLYPELNWPNNIAFPRGAVPLSVLLLLHEKVALYVPPASRSMLEQRWGVSLDMVLQLCHEGLIQPLIGHPTDYRFKHFEPLLELRPPSVWARGLGLLRALGMEDTLNEASVRLPLEEITSLSWVRRRWKRHFPNLGEAELTENIKREIATQYADLWVFGLSGIAQGLAHLKHPSKIAQALFLANETRTYPVLLGLGGSAHYDMAKVRAEPSLLKSDKSVRAAKRFVVPSELEVLLRGIGLNIEKLDVNDIVEFHASGSGLHLRAAMSYFGDQGRLLLRKSPGGTVDQFFDAAAQLQDSIREATKVLADPDFRREAHNTRERIKFLFRAGSIAVGAGVASALGAATWLGMLPGVAVGLAIAEKLVPPAWREKVISEAVAEQFSPGIAHLWNIIEKRELSKL